ncbi:MAG: DUF1232 domain-containing protein [Oleiphilaceae bacterium]|nr:DUF1232 domain-containing protein [Oleiphilaceae bacterium]
MQNIDQYEAQRALKKESDQITPGDLDRVLETQDKIEQKVAGSSRLKRFMGDIKLMFAMLKDYWQGNYRSVPWLSIAAIAGALLYVLNPLDLIPDIIFIFGLMDDATVMAACLAMVRRDLNAYQAWKSNQET